MIVHPNSLVMTDSLKASVIFPFSLDLQKPWDKAGIKCCFSWVIWKLRRLSDTP